MWLLQGLCGCYWVHIPFFFFSKKNVLTGNIYVKVWLKHWYFTCIKAWIKIETKKFENYTCIMNYSVDNGCLYLIKPRSLSTLQAPWLIVVGFLQKCCNSGLWRKGCLLVTFCQYSIQYCKSGNICGTVIFANFSKREFKNPRKYLQYFVCTFWTRRSCVLTICVDANG